MSQLAGHDAIQNHHNQAGTKAQTNAQRGEQSLFIRVALVRHQKHQTRGETGDKRYHEQHDEGLEHDGNPFGSAVRIVGKRMKHESESDAV